MTMVSMPRGGNATSQRSDEKLGRNTNEGKRPHSKPPTCDTCDVWPSAMIWRMVRRKKKATVRIFSFGFFTVS